MKTFYKTKATAKGGRSGHSELDDGSFGVDLAVPGTNKSGVNPEQLFALGYAACFDNAIPFAAKKLGISAPESTTSIEVGIGENDSGGYGLDIDIHVTLTGVDQQQADELVEATHQVCPYSNATRGNVDVRLHTSVN